MSGILLPILLALGGVVAAFATYRGIRRGGARYYTLERESLLRQASLTLLASTLLFLGAIGLMVYSQQQAVAEEEATIATEEASEGTVEAVQAEETPVINSLPPLPTETPLPGPSPTPTALICRASVEGTFDNGVTLRDAPGGEQVSILPELSILTVITEEEAVEFNNYRWVKVRSLLGEEGWVADDFLTLGQGCE